VVAIPNAVFYDHREQGAAFVRFAFCKRTEVLTDATERLRKAFAG
jgi:N-succinyldiaminopimelate aminotransferase